jgi:hypothetical protein
MIRTNALQPPGWLVLILLVLTSLGCGLYMGSSAGSASASGTDLPPNLVKGARVVAYIPAMMKHQQFTIEDVRGHWVLGTAIEVGGWVPGAKIWVNLETIQSMDIIAPTEVQKK